jgi:hypothetical protein
MRLPLLALSIGYEDVRAAWRYYLAHDNGNRGVVRAEELRFRSGPQIRGPLGDDRLRPPWCGSWGC